jgi:hypothetical protein
VESFRALTTKPVLLAVRSTVTVQKATPNGLCDDMTEAEIGAHIDRLHRRLVASVARTGIRHDAAS